MVPRLGSEVAKSGNAGEGHHLSIRSRSPVPRRACALVAGKPNWWLRISPTHPPLRAQLRAGLSAGQRPIAAMAAAEAFARIVSVATGGRFEVKSPQSSGTALLAASCCLRQARLRRWREADPTTVRTACRLKMSVSCSSQGRSLPPAVRP